MRFGGKRVVDVLADSSAELAQDERDLLAAHRNSRCSLFAIISADPVASQIKLRDVLEPLDEIDATSYVISDAASGHAAYKRV